MKLVILSGAGLSTHSGLPAYETIKDDKSYQHFFSATKKDAIEIAETFYKKYSSCKPNQIHKQLSYIEKYCEVFDIEFHHYTLNVDDLIEQAGANVTHIHGSIDDYNSLIEHRFTPKVDLDSIVWNQEDILVVAGVSNDGYPLAYLESQVISSGARFYNYNLHYNDALASKTNVGDLLNTFSSLSIVGLIHCEFDAIDYVEYLVEVKSFYLAGREYEVYFSPSYDVYFCSDETEIIEKLTAHNLRDHAYEIKFDLVSNRVNEEGFAYPKDNYELKDLNHLGFILAAIINSHANLKNGKLYTATAAKNKLIKYYNRLARKYSNELQYDKWCAFGPQGVNYAFKKK